MTSAQASQRSLPIEDLGAHRIACQNNLEFLGRLADESVKLIVTSPPYNIGKDYERRTSVSAYLEAQRSVIAECVRVLHPQGSICWQVGNYVENGEIIPLDVILYPAFREQGLRLRNRIVWHFGSWSSLLPASLGTVRDDQLVDEERYLHMAS